MKTNGSSIKIPCINISRLQPGDVLLTSSPNLRSKLLGQITNGEYSHAAIVLTSGTILESTPDAGIHQKHMPSGELIRNGSGSDMLFPMSECYSAQVLRHFDYIGISSSLMNEIEQEIMDLFRLYHGLNYPKYEKLVMALPQESALKKFGYILFPSLASGTSRELDGPFCSYLVAAIYEGLGKKLFDFELDAANFSPNTFCSSNYLEKVESVVEYNDIDLVRKLRIESSEVLESEDTITNMMDSLNELARIQMKHTLETKRALETISLLEAKMQVDIDSLGSQCRAQKSKISET